MKFVNTKPHALHFEIDGVVYDVGEGGSCEIPDKISYVVKGRGLPLKPADELADEEASKPKKAKAPQKEAAPAPADEEASKPKR